MKKASSHERKLAYSFYAIPLVALALSSSAFFLPDGIAREMSSFLISSGIPLVTKHKELLSASHPDWQNRIVAIYATYALAPIVAASGAFFVLKLWVGYRNKYIDKRKKQALKRIALESALFMIICFSAIFLPGKDLVLTGWLTKKFGSSMVMALIGEFWAAGSLVALLIEDAKLIYQTKEK